MSEQKRRVPGKRAFPEKRPPLVLVPSPQKPIRPDVRTEMSQDVKLDFGHVSGKSGGSLIG